MSMNETPSDEGITNDERASWAEAALIVFAQRTGLTKETLGDKEDPFLMVSDLLADLAHWCDRSHVDLPSALEHAGTTRQKPPGKGDSCGRETAIQQIKARQGRTKKTAAPQMHPLFAAEGQAGGLCRTMGLFGLSLHINQISRQNRLPWRLILVLVLRSTPCIRTGRPAINECSSAGPRFTAKSPDFAASPRIRDEYPPTSLHCTTQSPPAIHAYGKQSPSTPSDHACAH
jgi:hypothetical protein